MQATTLQPESFVGQLTQSIASDAFQAVLSEDAARAEALIGQMQAVDPATASIFFNRLASARTNFFGAENVSQAVTQFRNIQTINTELESVFGPPPGEPRTPMPERKPPEEGLSPLAAGAIGAGGTLGLVLLFSLLGVF